MNNILRNKQRLLDLYFILLRISYLFSAYMVLNLMSEGFYWMFFGAVVAGLGFLGLQFFVSLKAEKLINERRYVGLVLALILNSVILPSYFFLLSLAGYYILLHQETRAQFPKEQNPEWLNEFFQWLDNVSKDFKKAA